MRWLSNCKFTIINPKISESYFISSYPYALIPFSQVVMPLLTAKCFMFTRVDVHVHTWTLQKPFHMYGKDKSYQVQSLFLPVKAKQAASSSQMISTAIKTTLVANHYPAASCNSSTGWSQRKRGWSDTRCSVLSGSCCAWCLCFGRLCRAKTDYNRRAVSSEEMLYGGIIA